MKPKKKQRQTNVFVGLIGMFFLMSSALFCGYVVYEDHLNLNAEGQADFSSIHKPNELESVNDHLKSVSDKMELERLKTLVANMKIGHGNTSDKVNNYEPLGDQPIVDFSGDPRVEQMAEDFGRNSELKRKPLDPRSIVYESVIEERKLQKQKEEDRRHQADAFIANARKDGWIVQLDPSTYKIKSYRRLESPEGSPSDVDYKGFEVVPK